MWINREKCSWTSKKDSLNFMQFKPKDAKDYIINRAKRTNVL
jgi:hypothetical protein